MTYELAGTQIGDIKVIDKCKEKTKEGRTQWNCICICGNSFIAVTYRLTSKFKLKSCGHCEWHIKHKEAYITWIGMCQRCLDTGHKDYPRYGGKGIIIQLSWMGFVGFFLDMGDPPKDMFGVRLTLDRKDNHGNYTKDNCRWATHSEQQLNKG